MFSRTESPAKGWTIWKVRTTPRAQITSGAKPRSEVPTKRMSPASGRTNPEIWANRVVLPAPFGPISAEIEPASTVSDTAFVATTPPKRLVTPTISSMARARQQAAQRDAAEAEQPVRHERYHEHQQHTVEHEIETRRLAEAHLADLGNAVQRKCAEHRPEHGAEPADDRRQQGFDRHSRPIGDTRIEIEIHLDID